MKRRIITDHDRYRLGCLLASHDGRAWGQANRVSTLDDRLEDAEAIASQETPRNLVTMNSTVELLDIRSGTHRRVTLTYPADCEFIPGGISVLDQLGIELLGSHVGGIVSDNQRRYLITKIIYQPEAVGALHL